MWDQAERFLVKDKHIGPLVKKYGSCTLKPRKKKDYFEDLVDAIVQQQLSMKAAASIFERIKEKISTKWDVKKNHKWRKDATKSVQVTPEKILALSEKELRRCGLSFAKIKYLEGLASKVKKGEVEIHKMDKLPDEKVMEELIAVKGIGRWTAEMFLMFSLARPDIFPVDDVGLQNAFKKLVKENMKPDKMEKFAERWKPYRTIASWYIWRSFEN